MDFSRLRDIIDTIYKALVRICEGFFFLLVQLLLHVSSFAAAE